MTDINESASSLPEDKKKTYTTPTLEKIGAVKDATRGGSGLNVDGSSLSAQTGGGSPSDAGFQ